MKYKLMNGQQVQLHEEDIKKISNMNLNFDIKKMENYLKDLHKHAIDKMERVSETIITDENSADIALENVLRNGTYIDFAKFLRYYSDMNISYHLLESVK